MSRFVRRALAVCLVALGVAGCDKCTDYPWVGIGTPHSCKDVAAPK